MTYSLELLRLFFWPMFSGTVYGVFPVFVTYICLFQLLKNFQVFGIFSNSYDDNALGLTQTVNLQINRAGLFVLATGFLLMRLNAIELMSFYKESEDKIACKKILTEHFKNLTKESVNKIKKYRPRKHGEHEQDIDFSELEEQEEVENNFNEQFYKTSHNPFMSQNQLLNLKLRSYYAVLLITLLLLVFFMVQMGFSFFQNFIFLFLFLNSSLEILTIRLTTSMLLNEILLACPLLVVFEISFSFVFMKVETYQFFLIYFARAVSVASARFIYFFVWKYLKIADNCQKSRVAPERWSFFFIYIFFSQKFKFLKKIFGSVNSSRTTNSKYRKFGFEAEYKKEIPREMLLLCLLEFSSRGCANLIRFMIMFYSYFYPPLNQSSASSAVDQSLIINHLLFSAIMVAFDVCLIYIFEHLFDFEIISLLNFYSFKYNRRKNDWLLERTFLDVSITSSFRTLDYLGFSCQYYVVLSSISVNLCLMAYTLYVIVENSYNFFNDASAILVIFFSILIILISASFFRWLFGFIELWRNDKKFNDQKFETNLKLEDYMASEYDLFREKFIIEGFLRYKKDWLVQNLDKILDTEDFVKNEGYLIDLHLKVTSHIMSVEIQNFRTEIIDKYKYVASLNDDIYSNTIVKTTPEVFNKLATLMHYWLGLAKDALYFKKIVEGVGLAFKKRLCEDCHTDEKLLVIEKNSLYRIISFYRAHLNSALPTKESWRRFYIQHQIFVTLCENCEKIRCIKRFKRNQENIETNYNNIKLKTDFSEKIMKDLIRIDLKIIPKMILHHWWLAARSNLLNKRSLEPKYKSKDYIRRVLDDADNFL